MAEGLDRFGRQGGVLGTLMWVLVDAYGGFVDGEIVLDVRDVLMRLGLVVKSGLGTEYWGKYAGCCKGK
eukprot:gene1210-2356_t